MPKFTDYTEKQIPEDNDSLMIYDAAANVNKHVLFSGFWKWIAKKLKEATLSDLQTTDKTVIGALNELNGNSLKIINCYQAKYNLDNYKNGIYYFQNIDSGINTGTEFPVEDISVTVQIGNVQIACAINNSYYIRYFWGTWKSWKKIS